MDVNADGRLKRLGLKVVDSKSEASQVKMEISDAHKCLTNEIRLIIEGSCWQR